MDHDDMGLNYIIDCIQCHVVTFLVTLLMNNFTGTLTPTQFKFIQMPIIEKKFGIFCILTNL